MIGMAREDEEFKERLLCVNSRIWLFIEINMSNAMRLEEGFETICIDQPLCEYIHFTNGDL